MDLAFVIAGAREALRMALLLGAIPLGAALAVGLVVGMFQTLTQLQEPTVALVPRLLTVALVVLLVLPWMISRWVVYAAELFGSIPNWI